MPRFDPERHAATFADPKSVLAWVARSLSEGLPNVFGLACIYRSHPALELACSAASFGGDDSGELPGLHAAFAVASTEFDRWAVQARQRDRWVGMGSLDDRTPLGRYWGERCVAPYRRIVLCEGKRPIAYASVQIPQGTRWQPFALAQIRARFRRCAPALRLAALALRSKQEPISAELLSGVAGALVLAKDGRVLAGSPEALGWLEHDDELQALTRAPHAGRLRRFDVRCATRSGRHTAWTVLGLTPREPVAPSVSLTPRERELCRGLVRGAKNAELASELGVAPSTVKTMLERLYARHGVQGRVALARLVLGAG